jgi:hypothetical protein
MSFADTTQLPPTSELYTGRQLSVRHPHLMNANRVAWALRNRERNGLDAAGAVFESPCGVLMVHEPKFLTWFLGLTSRAKPRRLRRRGGES